MRSLGITCTYVVQFTNQSLVNIKRRRKREEYSMSFPKCGYIVFLHIVCHKIKIIQLTFIVITPKRKLNVHVIKTMGNWKISITLFQILVISADAIWHPINLVICTLKRINGFIAHLAKLLARLNCYINIKRYLLYIHDSMIIKNI